MFCGAVDNETALLEVYDGCRSIREPELSLGLFETTLDFEIIDLTNLPPIPSMFDPASRRLRLGLRFLQEFVQTLKRPLTRDGSEHVEYVPTQVVTEYFRRVFKNEAGDSVWGILYPSSRNGRPCCVLFVEADECGGEPIPFRSRQRTQRMRLDVDSIQRVRATLTFEDI